MEHVGDRPRHFEGHRHVVLQELEVGTLHQVGDVVPVAGQQVVDAYHLVPLAQQTLAQVRAEETGAAGDHRAAHAGVSEAVWGVAARLPAGAGAEAGAAVPAGAPAVVPAGAPAVVPAGAPAGAPAGRAIGRPIEMYSKLAAAILSGA